MMRHDPDTKYHRLARLDEESAHVSSTADREEANVIELAVTTSHLPELLRRLDEGWWIEEPLLQRSILFGLDGRRSVLEAVICKDRERCVIALGDEPEVQAFVAQRGLRLLEL
jgi:hypothetical protein